MHLLHVPVVLQHPVVILSEIFILQHGVGEIYLCDPVALPVIGTQKGGKIASP